MRPPSRGAGRIPKQRDLVHPATDPGVCGVPRLHRLVRQDPIDRRCWHRAERNAAPRTSGRLHLPLPRRRAARGPDDAKVGTAPRERSRLHRSRRHPRDGGAERAALVVLVWHRAPPRWGGLGSQDTARATTKLAASFRPGPDVATIRERRLAPRRRTSIVTTGSGKTKLLRQVLAEPGGLPPSMVQAIQQGLERGATRVDVG